MAFMAALPSILSAGAGLMGAISGGGSKEGKVKTYEQLSPEQRQRFQELIQQSGMSAGMQYLQGLASGDESTFAESEAPAMRQLGEMQGSLASRFSGMGMGGRKSSGFQNAVGGQAREMAEDLAAKRQGMRSNAIQSLMGLNQSLLNIQPTGQYMQAPRQKANLWSPGAEFAGSLLGARGA